MHTSWSVVPSSPLVNVGAEQLNGQKQFSVVKQLYRGAGERRKERREKSGGLPNTFDRDCGYYINVLH